MKKSLSIIIFLLFYSQGFCQDAKTENDSSHVLISAIKTVSGNAPENEFFMANLKIRYTDHFLSIANVDIALSNTGTDTLTSAQKKLTDGGIYMNWDFSHTFNSSFRTGNNRSLFTGLGAKIFNTEAYYGPLLGSLELKNSKLNGTYFLVGYFRRFFLVPDTRPLFNDSDQRLANDNLFTEFLIHSESLTFFEYLSFRAGVLVPLIGSKGRFEDIQFRITVAVPVGDLINF